MIEDATATRLTKADRLRVLSKQRMELERMQEMTEWGVAGQQKRTDWQVGIEERIRKAEEEEAAAEEAAAKAAAERSREGVMATGGVEGVLEGLST